MAAAACERSQLAEHSSTELLSSGGRGHAQRLSARTQDREWRCTRRSHSGRSVLTLASV